MNIHFSQVERRSQLFSYLLAAFALYTVMMLILSLNNYFEHRGTMLSSNSSQVAHTESSSVPVVIPAPLPPTDQIQIIVTPLPSIGSNPIPQAVPVPAPSVP
jgi:hypothetical protein